MNDDIPRFIVVPGAQEGLEVMLDLSQRLSAADVISLPNRKFSRCEVRNGDTKYNVGIPASELMARILS